mmetsp:Transcript_107818/g.300594  ORF Transcript_107818/g.300594 Transcript_107818/m.300594 type:complete len:285 (+) Transcript_107818:412-1266(+)
MATEAWPNRVSCILLRRSSISLSSTPNRVKDARTLLLSLIRLHSASQMNPSFEASIDRNASVRVLRKSAICRVSSSSLVLSSITWHRTPMSIFNSVIPEIRMKSTNNHISKMFSSLMAMSVCARLSPSTPLVKSVIIDEPRSENISFAVGSSPLVASAASTGSPSWLVNMIAKTYMTMTRKSKMKTTACIAFPMLLMRVISSGKKRMSFAMRVSRNNLNSLKLVKCVSTPLPPSAPAMASTSGKTHVSSTMNTTSVASNTNHASQIHLLFMRNARNRTTTSMKK